MAIKCPPKGWTPIYEGTSLNGVFIRLNKKLLKLNHSQSNEK